MASLQFDPKDIAPLLQNLGIGASPDNAPPPEVAPPAAPPTALPPAPLPPVPAQAGFNAWSADPQNQKKVADGVTQPGQPLVPAAAGGQFAGVAPMADTQPTAPPTAGAPGRLAQDTAELQRLQTTGSGASQIKNPWLRTIARIGDAAGTVLAPGIMAAVPGSTVHNWTLQNMQQGRVANDQSAIQAAAVLEDTKSQSAQRDAAAKKAQAQADNVGNTDALRAKQVTDAAKLGMVPTYDPTTGALTGFNPDETSPIAKSRTAKDQLLAAQTDSYQAGVDLKNATADLTRLKQQNYDPNSEVFKLAVRKANTAQQNANAMGIRAQSAMMNSLAHTRGVGLDGQPLAGAMVTDDGQTVGSTFSQNVRPTGTERNKGDMANSADEQLKDIKGVMQRNRGMFGPGYGQSTAFKKWIGAQSPDAQIFMSARTIAADHLAGTFGGRSEAALDALDNAIGQFKDNPTAAIAGVDQLTKANTRFMAAGTVRTIGGNRNGGNAPPPTTAGFSVTAPDSSIHRFATQAQANQFKKLAGIK